MYLRYTLCFSKVSEIRPKCDTNKRRLKQQVISENGGNIRGLLIKVMDDFAVVLD